MGGVVGFGLAPVCSVILLPEQGVKASLNALSGQQVLPLPEFHPRPLDLGRLFLGDEPAAHESGERRGFFDFPGSPPQRRRALRFLLDKKNSPLTADEAHVILYLSHFD